MYITLSSVCLTHCLPLSDTSPHGYTDRTRIPFWSVPSQIKTVPEVRVKASPSVCLSTVLLRCRAIAAVKARLHALLNSEVCVRKDVGLQMNWQYSIIHHRWEISSSVFHQFFILAAERLQNHIYTSVSSWRHNKFINFKLRSREYKSVGEKSWIIHLFAVSKALCSSVNKHNKRICSRKTNSFPVSSRFYSIPKQDRAWMWQLFNYSSANTTPLT